MFTVVLNTEPTGDVVISVLSSDTGEATLSPSMLTFTAANWSTPQTVTITGVDDDIDDGDQSSTATVVVNAGSTADSVYDALGMTTAAPIGVTTTDDDTVGFTLSTTLVSVAETGTTAQFTVVLDTEPEGNVVIRAYSSDSGEAQVGGPLTFTSSNWDIPKTFTITGVDDSIADGEQQATFTVEVFDASSHDAYDDVADQSVTAAVADDETPGITVTQGRSYPANTVAEYGSTYTVEVNLTIEPSSEVVLSVSSADTGEVTVSPSTLTFTASAWPASQTLAFTGVDDDVDDGNVVVDVTISVVDASSDNAYDTVGDKTLAITNTDDDTAGFTLSTTSVSVAETGTTDTFTVVLDSQPEGNVVIIAHLADPADQDEAQVGSPLTFTSSNWDTPKTFTITGRDDPDLDGEQQAIFTVRVDDDESHDGYDDVTDQTVTATVADDEPVIDPPPTTSTTSTTSTTTTTSLAIDPPPTTTTTTTTLPVDPEVTTTTSTTSTTTTTLPVDPEVTTTTDPTGDPTGGPDPTLDPLVTSTTNVSPQELPPTTPTLALDPDLDGDGLTASQEEEVDTDPDDPDTDDDGCGDGDEVARGTDPTNPDTDGDGYGDCEELNELVSDPLDPTDPGIDTDDDGLPDELEEEIGTDPEDDDTDDDDFGDKQEFDRGTDPLDPSDPGDDCDNDNFADTEELAFGTDECDPDTDDDGLLDGFEIDAGLDPLDPDSDNDGISDGDELAAGTNPNTNDSDGDGLTDSEEQTLGTDPDDADTDDDGISDSEEVNQLGTDPLDPNDPGVTFTRSALFTPQQPQPDPDTDDGGSGFPWWILLALPAVAVLIAVAVTKLPQRCKHCERQVAGITGGVLVDRDGNAECVRNPDGHETRQRWTIPAIGTDQQGEHLETGHENSAGGT